MPANLDDFIDPLDFESITLKIRLKNLSTEKTVDDTPALALIEVGEGTLTLSAPSSAFTINNRVMLEILDGGKGASTAPILLSTGKVEEIQGSDDDKISRIQVKLVQFDKKSWSHFLKLFSKRQSEIERFFMMGKK